MAEIGKQRKQKKFFFPLIGVASDGLSIKEDPEFVLEPNRMHFFLIPGEDWGDESA